MARYNIVPSAIVEGHYRKVPMVEWICPCGSEIVETLEHVLLGWKLYNDICAKYSYPLLGGYLAL